MGLEYLCNTTFSMCIRNGYFEANQVVVRRSPHGALAQLHRERQVHRLGRLQQPQSSLLLWECS
jgi:hypothetical protein